MRRLVLPLTGAVLLVLVGSGCGPDRSGSLGQRPTDPPPSPTASGPAGPASPPGPATGSPGAPAASPDHADLGRADPDEPDRSVTIQVWLTRGGEVFPTSRTRPYTLATSRLALTELVAGPTATEAAAGVRTGLAPGTDFDISISGGVATVDLPAGFYAGGRDPARLRQAQVVFTLTQFPSVSKVGFQSGGEAVAAPVSRSDYDDLLPLIVVTSLVIGQRVTSPVTIAGTANVFEATVSIRILDAAGTPVATTFTNATCGTGCRGDYSAVVSYRVAAEQPGRVQVYQVSPEDGSPTQLVDLPVRLAPSR
jgi:hypothetical protein